jgi:hypothetical protein
MKIKNWSKFQHFKDRKPPWVKLYRDLLDDIEWHELDPMSAKVLCMLWLIASEDDGNVPELKTLSFRLRLPLKTTKECLSKLNHWLIHDDINMISDGYQSDGLETERETELEIEKETEREGKRKASRLSPNWVLSDDDYNFCRTERPDLDPQKIAESFKDYWLSKPKDASKTDWSATWRNWVRRQDVPKTQQKSFYERDLELKKARHDEMVGKNKRKVFDITPNDILELK